MREFSSEALVLSIEPSGAFDSRVSFFTKEFGKLTAKAKSAKKITSKLAGHLQPGYVVRARFIEKNSPQVVDALKSGAVALAPADLDFLSSLLPEAEPERELYTSLVGSKSWSWSKVLSILGWDPRAASCRICADGSPTFFSSASQDFFCTLCASKLERDTVFCINR